MTSISDTEVVNAPGGLVELGYLEYTGSNVQLTGSANTYIGGTLTCICDGSPIIIEVYCPRVDMAANSDSWIAIEIDGVSQGRVLAAYNPNSGASPAPTFAQIRATPAAGTRTFRMRAYSSSGTTTWLNGAGVFPNTYIRVSKVLQASQLLVTQSNAPIVTSLPSGNLVTGQEVDLYVTTPYAGYQRHKWDGSAWYIIGDSRSVGAWQSWTPTITQGGNVAYTLSRARYVINGKTVQMMMGGTITGSGTSGNAINISLPTPAFTGVNFLTGRTGTFHYFRSASGFRYTGILELNSTTTGVMVSEETGGGALGASPAFGAGANDQIAITATYEVN